MHMNRKSLAYSEQVAAFADALNANSMREFIRFCRQSQIPILVMAAQADHAVQQITSLTGRLMIVFGSEKDGCSETLMSAATLHVQIPTFSKVESLNVFTAAAIMLDSRAWFNIPKARK